MHPSKIERTWGVAPQALAVIAHVVSMGLLTWVPGLIVHWLWRGRSRFVAFHALQSLYLSIALGIVGTIGFLLSTIGLGLIGYPIMFINFIAGAILWISGAVHASRGETFEYPILGAIARRKTGL